MRFSSIFKKVYVIISIHITERAIFEIMRHIFDFKCHVPAALMQNRHQEASKVHPDHQPCSIQ